MNEIKLKTPRKKQEIKEIAIFNKKTLTASIKKNPNEINIIPIKIALTPRIKQNLIKSFNSTSSHKLYQKNNISEEIKKNIIQSKIITMTPKVETNFSNVSSITTSPRVIIKNFNYNNVYNIGIDKDDKNKKSKDKIYKNYTYNKPKTTSNFILKGDMIINFNSNKNVINYNSYKKQNDYLRIHSEKNIFTKRKNGNDIIINTEIKESNNKPINRVNTLYYNNKNYNNNINKTIYNKEIKRTLSNITIKRKNNLVQNNNIIPFNLNELSIIFEKINLIIISLSKNKGKNLYTNCQDFFIFYRQSSLKKIFPSFFAENYKLIIDSSINLCLFSLIVIYILSSQNLLSYNLINIIERILLHCKINFALYMRQIQLRYKINLENLFQKYLISKNIINVIKEQDLINIIYQNSKDMTNDIKSILNYYKTINTKFYNNIIDKFNNISNQKEDDFIFYFFNEIINTRKNINNIILSPRKNAFENLSIKKDYTSNKLIIKKLVKRKKVENLPNKIEIPYIKTPPMKQYTLILDLDKTLYYKNNLTGEIILRNGLFSFLSSLKPFYEIISFSLEPKNFCDNIINMIERDKKYFDFKFYKEHSIVYENNLVKDISLIGRDVSKVIIVDDDEICFKLNKENGIKIYPFNGENNNDDKLFELKKILKEIYVKNFDDVRKALKYYEKDILNKITLI